MLLNQTIAMKAVTVAVRRLTGVVVVTRHFRTTASSVFQLRLPVVVRTLFRTLGPKTHDVSPVNNDSVVKLS